MLGLGSDLSPAPAQALRRDGSAQVRSGPTQQDLTTSITYLFSCSAKGRKKKPSHSLTNQPVQSPTVYECLEPGRRNRFKPKPKPGYI